MDAGNREFWDSYSGVSATPDDSDRAAARNAAARTLMDSTGRTADEVAVLLCLAPSTVRRRSADRKLYAYRAGDRLLFPAWQLSDARENVIPSLESVLSVLQADLHPQSVAGFFLTPQPDLVLHGSPELARGLAAGY